MRPDNQGSTEYCECKTKKKPKKQNETQNSLLTGNFIAWIYH